jgi:hypothetical protein
MRRIPKGEKRKDLWDKFEIIGKLISSVLVGVAIAFIGFYSSKYLNDRQNNELRFRLYTELISKREDAESAIRKDMFKSIIDTYTKQDTVSLDNQVLDLELLTYNFHESICIKPLYLHLVSILDSNSTLDTNECKGYHTRMFKAAREITGKQVLALQSVGVSFERTIRQDDLPANLDPCTLELESITRTFTIQVFELDLDLGEMEVEVSVTGDGEPYVNDFSVGPFDFPMIDNSRLSNDQRFAVVLNEFDNETATITLVYFPGSHSSLKEKPFYQDVINHLLNNEKEI